MLFSFASWRRSRGAKVQRRPNYVPRLLELEERALLSTLTVMNLHDSGAGSLRAELAASNSDDQGGGILNDGSNLTLSGDSICQNAVLESLTSAALGGGLRSVSGTVTISDCQITDNQAAGLGRAPRRWGTPAGAEWPFTPAKSR